MWVWMSELTKNNRNIAHHDLTTQETLCELCTSAVNKFHFFKGGKK